MKLGTLVEVLNAVHLSKYVDSPFKQRGGIMLVAPPASLKSTLLGFLQEYPQAIVVSDLNVQSFKGLRTSMVAGHISTLVFSDLEKLYQRHGNVASNLEGHLKGIVDEGFRRPSFEDQRAVCVPAHATVIACMTENFYERKISQWLDDGFARRFIWVHYQLANPEAILRAISRWQPINTTNNGNFIPKVPSNRSINGNLFTDAETQWFEHMLRYHPQRETPLILMRKMAAVLRWKFRKEWKKILRDFEPSLGPNGTRVTL